RFVLSPAEHFAEVGHHGTDLRAPVHETGDWAGGRPGGLSGERFAAQRHQPVAAPLRSGRWVRPGLRQESRRGDDRGVDVAVHGGHLGRVDPDLLCLVLPWAAVWAGVRTPGRARWLARTRSPRSLDR